MTPERWKLIEALFEACLAREPAERGRLLEEREHDDPELVREVEALLGEAERTGRLEALVEGPARAAMATLGALGPGDRVGAYRLETLLGEGGMGKVFLARRDDDAFEQQVAVKLLPPGAAARGLEARFLAERQILARLEHPHIARLLDGGTTGDGQPFLVMEFVDGETLVDHCDRQRLGIRARLRLFRQVTSAVEHAHRHLVVHRDIKPANILVHPESGPKLLDFGIAKMLEADGSDPGDLTRQQDRLLTPDYASPEQILGEAVTTLSDVYSLGVLLFELLTGERPRHLEAKTPAARVRELTRTTPQLPSVQVRRTSRRGIEDGDEHEHPARLRQLEPAQLAKRLEGDLDVIALRALDPEPARRYGSVAELSADIDRHLAGEPVLARPDTWRYRTGKLVRRHPWGTAAVVAIGLLLVVLGVGLAAHAVRVGVERDRALAAEAEARTVSDFLTALFEVADPKESRGETVTARELLERGSEMIETELADEPGVQASLLATLGDVHLNLGLRRRAEALHRRALERRLGVLGDEHLDTATSHDRLGDTLRQVGRFEDAETELRQALAIREAALPADDPAIADSLNNLGLLLLERDRHDEAEPLLRRGLAIRSARLGDSHPDTDVSRSNLGQLLMDIRRSDEASIVLETVLANRQERLGENHPKVANSVHILATLRHLQGDLAAAERLFERAIRIRRRVLPAHHSHLAASLNNMASLLHDQWRLDEAARYYQEALDIDRLQTGGDALGYAFSLNNYGSLLEDLGRNAEAEDHYRRSAELRRQIQGEGSASYRRMISKLGRLAIRAGDLDRAEALLTETEAWFEANLPGDETDRIRNVERLAVLRRAQGDASRSASLLGDALERARRGYGPDHRILAELNAELAMTLAESAEPASCRGAVAAARAVFERGAGSDIITQGRIELAAGLCARAVGQDAEADRALTTAWSLLEPRLGADNHWVRTAATSMLG